MELVGNLSIIPFYKHPLVVYVFSFGGLAIYTFGKNVTFVSGLGLQQRHVIIYRYCILYLCMTICFSLCIDKSFCFRYVQIELIYRMSKNFKVSSWRNITGNTLPKINMKPKKLVVWVGACSFLNGAIFRFQPLVCRDELLYTVSSDWKVALVTAAGWKDVF